MDGKKIFKEVNNKLLLVLFFVVIVLLLGAGVYYWLVIAKNTNEGITIDNPPEVLDNLSTDALTKINDAVSKYTALGYTFEDAKVIDNNYIYSSNALEKSGDNILDHEDNEVSIGLTEWVKIEIDSELKKAYFLLGTEKIYIELPNVTDYEIINKSSGEGELVLYLLSDGVVYRTKTVLPHVSNTEISENAKILEAREKLMEVSSSLSKISSSIKFDNLKSVYYEWLSSDLIGVSSDGIMYLPEKGTSLNQYYPYYYGGGSFDARAFPIVIDFNGDLYNGDYSENGVYVEKKEAITYDYRQIKANYIICSDNYDFVHLIDRNLTLYSGSTNDGKITISKKYDFKVVKIGFREGMTSVLAPELEKSKVLLILENGDLIESFGWEYKF